MPAYPSYPQMVGSVETQVDDTLISRARGGGVKIRKLFAARKDSFKIVHKNMTNTDKNTYQAFYDANRTNVFTLTWPGVGGAYTFSVYFAGPLVWTPNIIGLWEVTANLIEA